MGAIRKVKVGSDLCVAPLFSEGNMRCFLQTGVCCKTRKSTIESVGATIRRPQADNIRLYIRRM